MFIYIYQSKIFINYTYNRNPLISNMRLDFLWKKISIWNPKASINIHLLLQRLKHVDIQFRPIFQHILCWKLPLTFIDLIIINTIVLTNRDMLKKKSWLMVLSIIWIFWLSEWFQNIPLTSLYLPLVYLQFLVMQDHISWKWDNDFDRLISVRMYYVGKWQNVLFR